MEEEARRARAAVSRAVNAPSASASMASAGDEDDHVEGVFIVGRIPRVYKPLPLCETFEGKKKVFMKSPLRGAFGAVRKLT